MDSYLGSFHAYDIHLGLDYVPIMLVPLHGQGLSPLFPLLLCTVLGYSLGTIYILPHKNGDLISDPCVKSDLGIFRIFWVFDSNFPGIHWVGGLGKQMSIQGIWNSLVEVMQCKRPTRLV